MSLLPSGRDDESAEESIDAILRKDASNGYSQDDAVRRRCLGQVDYLGLSEDAIIKEKTPVAEAA